MRAFVCDKYLEYSSLHFYTSYFLHINYIYRCMNRESLVPKTACSISFILCTCGFPAQSILMKSKPYHSRVYQHFSLSSLLKGKFALN